MPLEMLHKDNVKMKTGHLFLLPAPLGNDSVSKQLPEYNKHILEEINYFIVENIRTARRYLKQINPNIVIDNLKFAELNEHTRDHELIDIFQPILNGENGGLISEAGLPCVADPGNNLVFMAHQLGIRVVPLVGPSSIMLALMASGFNGQNFVFHGYLPIDKRQREQKLKEIERQAWQNDQTQIFIETPYRNMQMLESIASACRADSRLCIAANLLSGNEIIINKIVKDWKSSKCNFHKQPAIFLIYK
jgi:16S rRNA (cytidine1402-2'-O)-methyltransferase